MQAGKLAPTPNAAPSARVVVERPPAGLLRGRKAGPRWLFALLGGLSLLLVLGFYLKKWRERTQ